MINRYKRIKIFYGDELSQYLQERLDTIIKTIKDEKDNYLLNVSDVDYIQHQVQNARVESLNIDNTQKYVSHEEREFSSNQLPSSFYRVQGTVTKQVITIHLPYSGNRELFNYTPSSRMLWTTDVNIGVDEICFDIVNFYDDLTRIKSEIDSTVSKIQSQLKSVNSDVNQYNARLTDILTRAFEERKAVLLKQNHVLTSLDIPLKKSGNVPATFAIPTPKVGTRIGIKRPDVNASGYMAEPTLEEGVYNEILRVIHDVGKMFERLPATYAGKDEEALRDHLLMMLEPNFEGSATGETFNKTGKTDILLRYEGENAFIAECKFWSGQKGFLETISQLLGYLTWRDSKAAVIMFVDRQNFSNILDTVKSVISDHPNYVQSSEEKEETWLNYIFHINNDRNRQVKLAVMLYHLPQN